MPAEFHLVQQIYQPIGRDLRAALEHEANTAEGFPSRHVDTDKGDPFRARLACHDGDHICDQVEP